MFNDRIDAGIQLAGRLSHFKNQDVVVLAIPRGGLPLGSIVAKSLDAPLDVALSKKIGSPFNKEYAIGAVSLENMVLSDAGRVNKSYIDEELDSFEDGPYQQDERDCLFSDDIDGNDSVDDSRTPERPVETQGNRE